MSRKGKKKAKEARQVDFSALERQGREDFRAGRYQQAISAWERCLKGEAAGVEVGAQGLVPLRADLGEAHYRLALSKPVLSQTCPERSQRVEGEDPALRISELRRAVKYCPEAARYRYALGLAYLLQGNEINALEEFLQALNFDDKMEEYRWGEALAWIRTDASGTIAMLEERAKIAEEQRSGGAVPQSVSPSVLQSDSLDPQTPRPPDSQTLRWWRLAGLAHLKAGNYGAALELVERGGQGEEELPYFRLLGAAGEFLAGNDAGAANRLESLLEDNSAALPRPFLRRAYYLLGATFLASRRFADTARSWEQCLSSGDQRVQDDLASLYLCLAREELAGERFAQTREMLTKALALRPGDKAVQEALCQIDSTLAQRAAQKGDWEVAARLWKRLVESGESEWARHNLALALEYLQRPDQANVHWQELARAWKKELKDSPDTKEQRLRLAFLHRHLAANYNKMGDSHRAAQEYEKALNYNPSDLDTRLEVAELYLDFDQYGSAIPHLKRVLEQRADDARALNALGIAYNLQGNGKEAIACWQKVLAMDPDNALAREMAAEHHAERALEYWNRGEYTKALAELQRQIELMPNSYPPHCNRGEIYLEMGKLNLAREAFAAAMALDPHNPHIAVDIGGHCLSQDKKKVAEEYFRQALRIRNDAYTLCDIGLAYAEDGDDFRKAQKYFQQALASGEKEIPLRIGEGLQRMESPLAGIYLEEAVRRDPENPLPHLILGVESLFWGHLEKARGELAQTERLLANPDIPGRREILEGLQMIKDMLAFAGRLDSLLGPLGPKFPRY